MQSARIVIATLHAPPGLSLLRSDPNENLLPTSRIDADKKRMGESGDLQQRLEKEYPWIPSEREHFGRPGTDYDFAARDPEEVSGEVEGTWLWLNMPSI